MGNNRLISPPDGDVLGTLSDGRVLATIAGVTGGAYGEKYLWKSARNLFGTATVGSDGKTVYYGVKPDGSADTSATAPHLGMNRQYARAALIVGAVAAIEFSGSEEVQFGLLGAAAVWGAHIIQQAFPALN